MPRSGGIRPGPVLSPQPDAGASTGEESLTYEAAGPHPRGDGKQAGTCVFQIFHGQGVLPGHDQLHWHIAGARIPDESNKEQPGIQMPQSI